MALHERHAQMIYELDDDDFSEESDYDEVVITECENDNTTPCGTETIIEAINEPYRFEPEPRPSDVS